jgi:hypothetical protein
MKQGANKERWQRVAKDKAIALLFPRVIIETPGELLLKVLQLGKVSTNIYLRRLHNFYLDMNWLPLPLIPKRQWPAIRFKEKRAVTWEEHCKIMERERNPERRAFYQIAWHLPDPFTLSRRVVRGLVKFVRRREFRRKSLLVGLLSVSVAVIVFGLVWISPKAPAPLPPPRRLANGTVLAERLRGGNGTLTIDNGTASDALVKIVGGQAHKALGVFYVASGNKVTIGHIPDGIFSIYFSSGADFDGAIGGFTRDKRFYRFLDSLKFVTEVRTTGSDVYTHPLAASSGPDSLRLGREVETATGTSRSSPP